MHIFKLLDSRVKVNREIVQLVQLGNKAADIALTLGPGDELQDRLEQRPLELRSHALNKGKGFMKESADRQQQIYQSTVISWWSRYCWLFSSAFS